MKYRQICSVSLLLLICLFFGCTKGENISSSSELPPDKLSVVQIYNIVKDYDYWHYSFDGSVKVFRGDEKISLRGESGICGVQFFDGWIYYVKAYDDSSIDFDIFRVRPNGEEPSVLLNSVVLDDDSRGSFHSFAFVDGYMYVNRGFQFFQYDMETKTTELLDGDISTYNIADNRLYFIGHVRKDFTIYVMDLETKEIKILLGDGIYGRDKESPELYYSNFIFIGDVMYYTKRNTRENDFYLVELYRYENGESTLIDDTDSISEYSLFENDSKLYYFIRDGKTGKLMQYNPKDGKLSDVATCNDYSSGGKIINGCFYYLDSDGEIQQAKM